MLVFYVEEWNRTQDAAALLLSGLVLVGNVRAESVYPNVGDMPAKLDRPAISVDEQSKLKKELNDARAQQSSQEKPRGAGQSKSKKP